MPNAKKAIGASEMETEATAMEVRAIVVFDI